MKPCYWSVFRFLRKGNLVRLDSTALSNSECLPSNTWSTQPYKGSKKIATLLRTAVVNKHTRYATFECTNTLQHCSKHSVLNASGQPFARHWIVIMGMLSEQVTTTWNTHEMKSIIFSGNIWPRSKTPQVHGQNKKKWWCLMLGRWRPQILFASLQNILASKR